MIARKRLRQFFGVGPIGVVISILILSGLYYLGVVLKIPNIEINPTLRSSLIAIFSIDAIYLLIGGNYYLRKSGRGERMAIEGPYSYIRHPIYSVWIYSIAGILSMIFYSWSMIVAVLPLSIIWSWLVQFEERKMLEKFGNKYLEYMDQTGQFMPSWKAMNKSAKEKIN